MGLRVQCQQSSTLVIKLRGGVGGTSLLFLAASVLNLGLDVWWQVLQGRDLTDWAQLSSVSTVVPSLLRTHLQLRPEGSLEPRYNVHVR